MELEEEKNDKGNAAAPKLSDLIDNDSMDQATRELIRQLQAEENAE